MAVLGGLVLWVDHPRDLVLLFSVLVGPLGCWGGFPLWRQTHTFCFRASFLLFPFFLSFFLLFFFLGLVLLNQQGRWDRGQDSSSFGRPPQEHECILSCDMKVFAWPDEIACYQEKGIGQPVPEARLGLQGFPHHPKMIGQDHALGHQKMHFFRVSPLLFRKPSIASAFSQALGLRIGCFLVFADETCELGENRRYLHWKHGRALEEVTPGSEQTQSKRVKGPDGELTTRKTCKKGVEGLIGRFGQGLGHKAATEARSC